jgi:hypothetical protein
MASALKTEKPEEITPMMQQTRDVIRQNLINQGHKPVTADIIISLASLQLRGKDAHVPPKYRDAVNETRDMMAFMPQLLKKGYTAEEANEIVGRARTGFEMPGMNRIENYDVSTVRDAMAYLHDNPKAKPQDATAGMMLKGPTRTPAVRNAPVKTEVARAEGESQLPILSSVPRKIDAKSMSVARLDRMLAGEKTETVGATNLLDAKGAKTVEMPAYTYKVTLYGGNKDLEKTYTVTLDHELPREDPSVILLVNLFDNKGIVSVKDSTGKTVTGDDLKLFVSTFDAAYTVSSTTTVAATTAKTAELPTFAYKVMIKGQRYTVTMNHKLVDNPRNDLLSSIIYSPSDIASIKGPRGQDLEFKDFGSDYVAAYRDWMKTKKGLGVIEA